MNKQDLLKAQSCILKVNIHCHGCEQKVKKLLQKTDGVYSVNIDAEQGKVVVVGDGVDPAKLIKKLNRSGKHAEMWGAQRGMNVVNNQNYPINNQLQNLQVVDNNSSKVGGKDNKSQNQHKVPPKVHKSVKFNLQQEEEFDASDEFDDNFDDYYDEEEEEEGHGHGHGHNKIMPVMGNGGGSRGPIGVINGPAMNTAHKGGHVGNYGSGKKGEAIDPAILQMMKGKGGNHNEAKNGNEGGKQNGGEHQRDKNNNGEKQKGYNNNGKKSAKKSEGGLLGRFLGYGRKSKKGGGAVGDTYQNKNNYNWGKEEKKGEVKLEGNSDGNNKSKNMNDFDFHDPLNGKNGKGSNGNGNEKMGPKVDNNGAVQGVPTMNGGGGGGYPQGMQMQPTLEQQQYMAMMMNQQQQQQANMNNMYPPEAAPMMYDRPQSSMNYMYPPPPMPSHPMADPITHTFSDENVESCSIM